MDGRPRERTKKVEPTHWTYVWYQYARANIKGYDKDISTFVEECVVNYFRNTLGIKMVAVQEAA